MGRYPTKFTAENSLSINTKMMKGYGNFCGIMNGSISWTRGSSISIHIDSGSSFIRFRYAIIGHDEEKKSMDYKFPLVKIPCNLGGFRWAFRCALYTNGSYCGRIAYVLYKASSDYFGCRHCMNIVYESQRKSGGSYAYISKIFDAEKKADKLRKIIHKRHYRWIPTRKVRRLRQLEKRIPPWGGDWRSGKVIVKINVSTIMNLLFNN